VACKRAYTEYKASNKFDNFSTYYIDKQYIFVRHGG